MRVRILGAHNTETPNTGLISFLVGDSLAIDAGSICRGLPLLAQAELKAVLLTHQHYDHIRDVPTLGLTLLTLGARLLIVASEATQEALLSHLLDGALYPNLAETPADAPTIAFATARPLAPMQVSGYTVTPVPIPHGVPTLGYQVRDVTGKSLFFTGDTGAGCSAAWEHLDPDLDLLFIDVTATNARQQWAVEHQHLTPWLLGQELAEFRKRHGRLPRVLAVHASPLEEEGIRLELEDLAEELAADISLGAEGMAIDL